MEAGTAGGCGSDAFSLFPHSEVSTELPFRLMHPKPEEKNPAGQLYLVFAFLLLLWSSHMNYYYCKACSDLACRGLLYASL